MIVTLTGGPEDGREVNVPADRLDDLPPQINVAGDREAGSGLSLARGWNVADPIEPSRLIVHVYRRETQRLGPLSRVAYVYEGTS